MIKSRTGKAAMTEFMHVHEHYSTDKDTCTHLFIKILMKYTWFCSWMRSLHNCDQPNAHINSKYKHIAPSPATLFPQCLFCSN